MQLTVGDTINLGVKLYRSNFKKYLKLSVIAHLWLLIPIYGWGRYLAIASQISDLGYQQLIDNSDSSFPSKSLSIGLVFHFLITAILVIMLSYLYAVIIFIVLFFIVAFLLQFFTALFSIQINNLAINSYLNSFLVIPIVILFYAFIFLLITWLYARLFVTDPILSLESQNNLLSPIIRSYSLTKGQHFKIIKIIWLSFAITIPVIMPIYFLLAILISFISSITSIYFPAITFSSLMIIYMFSWFFLTNLLIIPLWQSIKAVVYYQMMCDREGVDLSIINEP